MSIISGGLLMYRIKNGELEVFIVHPGGPFHEHQDLGSWSIPKGEVEEGEEIFEAAKREFFEEIGIKPNGPFIELGKIKQKGGKEVYAWAFKGDWNGIIMKQSIIEIEYPPKSGKKIKIPENDKAGFFSIEEASKKLNQAQVDLVKRLEEYLKL